MVRQPLAPAALKPNFLVLGRPACAVYHFVRLRASLPAALILGFMATARNTKTRLNCQCSVRARHLGILVACVTFLALNSVAGEKLERGLELYKAKKYGEAETVLREAVSEEPDNPQAHDALGLTLLELKKFQEAADEFNKALGIGPPSDKTQVSLARAYLELKEWDKAQAALTEAQAINSENPEIYYYRGMLAAARRDDAVAAREFEKAIELNPSYAYAYYQAGIVYNRLKKPDKMVHCFETFLKLAPNAPEAKKVQALLRSIR